MGAIKLIKISFLKIILGLIVAVSVIAVVLSFWAVGGQNQDFYDYSYTNSLNIVLDKPIYGSDIGSLPIEPVKRSIAPAEDTQKDAVQTHNYEDLDSLFHDMGINIRENTDAPDQTSENSLNYCKKIVYNGLISLPTYHVNSLENLTFNLKTEGKRGLAGNGFMILRCAAISDEDLIAVLIHEMGHIVDGSYLTGTDGAGKSAFLDLGKPVPNDDKSIGYYEISWVNDSKWKEGISENHFCSRYGGTDPYEDFAECYIYYILHGEEFRKISDSNSILKEKYDFFKNNVFSGMEYSLDKYTASDEYISKRPLPADVVQLPYNYDFFINQ